MKDLLIVVCLALFMPLHSQENTSENFEENVKIFSEKIKPHVLTAENHGIKIGIENHSNNLINTPDSIKWLLELLPSENIGIALAPYHLQTLTLSAEDIANLIREINDRLFMFYAWQYGMGCMKKLPKEKILLQKKL